MMKFFRYIPALLALLLLGSCQDDSLMREPDIPVPGGVAVEGDSIEVPLSLQMPEMTVVSTRSMGESPDYSDLHLYLVEFADNGSPLTNTLTGVYEAYDESPSSDLVSYRVKLPVTEEPRVLHLVALPRSQRLDVGYGIEASVIPSLTVSDGVAAYWRRLSFPSGYVMVDGEGNALFNDDLDRLSHVALVRNFSQINLRSDASDFRVEGFCVVNTPRQGSVAAWNASGMFFAECLDDSQTQVPFDELSRSYSGNVPDGMTLLNPDSAPVMGGTEPKYVYERPFNSIHHTFIVVKGRRSSDSASTYYKLDIGRNDSNGIFGYYNILRNFRYNIVIRSVRTAGYKTLQEAAEGVVFNNFSFDVETLSMMNISDGREIVYVNFTSAVLTSPEEEVVDFKYRYRDLNYTNAVYNNDGASLVGLEVGPVIKKIEYVAGDDADGWRTVRLTCNPAEAATRVQTFAVVKPSGLGRTVNLVLHRKWNFNGVSVYNGTHQNHPASGLGVAGAGTKAELTLFFDIPEELPESMFPLVFTMEADHQNIENNPIGTLVVTSDKSYFTGVSGDRIKYEKTVTWTQYNELMDQAGTNNGTKIENPDGTVTHRVRCRFRTTTSLADLGVSQTTTEVRIHNDNFNMASAYFTRKR